MTSDWDDSTSVAGSPSGEPGERQASLVVLRGANTGEVVVLSDAEVVIGRGAGADLRIQDEGVSRFHCKLRPEGGEVVVEDLASRNGTFCNGDRVIGGPRVLKDGDRLELGNVTAMRFIVADTRRAGFDDPADGPDPVTGAHRRSYFVEQLDHDVRHAIRHRSALTLLAIRVDGFAAIVEKHGQTGADRVLASFADHLRSLMREGDLLARFSGEDFAVVIRGGSSADTFMLAQRARASSARLPIATERGNQAITVSIGVATVDELRIEGASDLRLAADAALQRARMMGGDRVVLCTPEILVDRIGQRTR